MEGAANEARGSPERGRMERFYRMKLRAQRSGPAGNPPEECNTARSLSFHCVMRCSLDPRGAQGGSEKLSPLTTAQC